MNEEHIELKVLELTVPSGIKSCALSFIPSKLCIHISFAIREFDFRLAHLMRRLVAQYVAHLAPPSKRICLYVS